jgi:ribosomal protein L29
MELHKLDMATIKSYDSARVREAETEIRKEMVNIRLDIYTARNQHTAKIRGLKKSLARLLTAKGQAEANVKTPAGKGK